MRKYLVIVRAGDQSLHPHWLAGEGDRSWDIIVNYYGEEPDRYRANDVARIDSFGPKSPALHDLLAKYPEYVSGYRYIWLPDDDLMTTKADINKLFARCEQYGLEAAQPSLTWNSYFSHLITLRNVSTRLRYTNFIEIMAPCLSSETLTRALPILGSTLTGWGMDFIWPRLVRDPQNGIAIIDEVAVRHTRPVGGPNDKLYRELLNKKGLSPWEELRQFCRLNGIDEEPTIQSHKAITRPGDLLIAADQPRRFALRLLRGHLPALRHTPNVRRLVRSMARVAWESIWQVPHHVSEFPMSATRARR